MPAKLPITSAKIESFCEAKMPVAAGSKPSRREHRPEQLAAEHVEQQDDGDEGEAATAIQHSTWCQISAIACARGAAGAATADSGLLCIGYGAPTCKELRL